MTIPMPGPPEWYDIDWNPVWGMVWVKEPDECDQTFNHAELDKKRLTDAECAAHYWQAFSYRARGLAEIINLPPHEARRIVKESDTWHRFDTHHHALEES